MRNYFILSFSNKSNSPTAQISRVVPLVLLTVKNRSIIDRRVCEFKPTRRGQSGQGLYGTEPNGQSTRIPPAASPELTIVTGCSALFAKTDLHETAPTSADQSAPRANVLSRLSFFSGSSAPAGCSQIRENLSLSSQLRRLVTIHCLSGSVLPSASAVFVTFPSQNTEDSR